MVVKKFEARSMKAALEMVKAEMGPEAIIVAARDNGRGYGLIGEGSVEITAAIQEAHLYKKQLVESKISQDIRDKVHKSSAKVHREFIEKVNTRSQQYQQPKQETPKPPVQRSQRYIEIEDDVTLASESSLSKEKIKLEAERKWKDMKNEISRENSEGVQHLQNEISSLKDLFKSMKEVPQSILATHPGSEFGLKYELASSFEQLISIGITTSNVVEILSKVQNTLNRTKEKNSSLIKGLIAQEIMNQIEVVGDFDSSKIEVFIGAGGHGKTSTLIKRASSLALVERKRVAIISTDNKKFGASEQLKIYSQILNIPFVEISSGEQWDLIAEELQQFDKVLVDSPGIRFRFADEIQSLKEILPPSHLKPRFHLVCSSTSKDQDALEIGRRFLSIGFDDVIFTALDESIQHGVLLNFYYAMGKPFHSFGLGSRVPEDYEMATKERIIDLLLGSHSQNLTATMEAKF